MIRVALAVALVSLSACGSDATEPSTEENRQLDAAENLLDEAPNELESVSDTLPNQN